MPENRKTPVYGYLSNPSMIDFPGRLAVIFFTSGCNFRCGFCHNAALLGSAKPGLTWQQLADACKKYREQWVDGIVISGGEPTLHRELPEIIRFFSHKGFKVKLDTNGSNPAMLRECLPMLDYVAMDIKTAPEQYPALTEFKAVEKVIESAEELISSNADYEFRTTIIEPVHNAAIMHEIGRILTGAKRYVIQPFVPHDNLPDPVMRGYERTSPQHMRAMAECVKDKVKALVVRGA